MNEQYFFSDFSLTSKEVLSYLHLIQRKEGNPIKMYYELMAISRISDPLKSNKEASRIASTIGRLILNNRGVIRDITSLGPRYLPKIVSKDQERHFQGYHFILGFDVSTNVQQELLRTLRRDPRILRANIIKQNMDKKLDVGTSFQRAYNSTPK